MMGRRQVAQGVLFYEVSIEEFGPADHPLWSSDRFVDVSDEARGIAPHMLVWDKSKRTDGTFLREGFVYNPTTDSYTGTSPGRESPTAEKAGSSDTAPQSTIAMLAR